MRVLVQCGRDGRISGPLGGHLGVDTLAKQIGFVRVPKTLERDLSDAGLAHALRCRTALRLQPLEGPATVRVDPVLV